MFLVCMEMDPVVEDVEELRSHKRAVTLLMEDSVHLPLLRCGYLWGTRSPNISSSRRESSSPHHIPLCTLVRLPPLPRPPPCHGLYLVEVALAFREQGLDAELQYACHSHTLYMQSLLHSSWLCGAVDAQQ